MRGIGEYVMGQRVKILCLDDVGELGGKVRQVACDGADDLSVHWS